MNTSGNDMYRSIDSGYRTTENDISLDQDRVNLDHEGKKMGRDSHNIRLQ